MVGRYATYGKTDSSDFVCYMPGGVVRGKGSYEHRVATDAWDPGAAAGFGEADLNALYSVHSPGMTSAAPMAVYRGYGRFNPIQKVKDFMGSPGIRLLALLVIVGFFWLRLPGPARSAVRRGGRRARRAAGRGWRSAKQRDWRGRKLKPKRERVDRDRPDIWASETRRVA